MTTTDLTPRQREIYEFIRAQILERGFGPTVRDVMRHTKIRSPNGVTCHLKALQKKRLITREEGVSRGIKLVGDGKRCPCCRQALPEGE